MSQLKHVGASPSRIDGLDKVTGAAAYVDDLAFGPDLLQQLPVLGVPMPSKHLQGLDSLLSMVQMPAGIPVATFAVGEAGATNAALFAIATLALSDPALAAKLKAFRKTQSEKVLAKKLSDLP